MYLKKLNLINFKNYSSIDIELNEKINCFVGYNGVGKTNLLDAVYYLSFCKSYFNPSDNQNIKYNEAFFVIQGNFRKQDNNETVYCGFRNGKGKVFKRNNKEYEKLADHIGQIPLVIITPFDTKLIFEGSDERRKFMDSVISQYDKKYLQNLIVYNKALSQRNQLLKTFAANRTFDQTQVEIWDEQLNKFGIEIYNKRNQFIKELLPIFYKHYENISEHKEKIELVYNSQLSNKNLLQLLSESIEKDRILQYTTKGTHKDDLVFKIDNRPLKKTASQGQQKTFITALKFAQFDFLKKIHQLNPILLLDDIFDKLDNKRVSRIMQLVGEENFGQIFITHTHPERLQRILSDAQIDYKIFTIQDNEVIE